MKENKNEIKNTKEAEYLINLFNSNKINEWKLIISFELFQISERKFPCSTRIAARKPRTFE